VPHQTTVYIEVTNPRLNETLQFVPSFSKVMPPDVLNTAITAAINNPLPGLLTSVSTSALSKGEVDILTKNLNNPPTPPPQEPPLVTNLRNQQQKVLKELWDVAEKILQTNTELSCLQAYEGTVKNGDNVACESSPSTDATAFLKLAQGVTKDVTDNAKLEVPVGQLAVVDGILGDVAKSCTTLQEGGTLTPNPMQLKLTDCESYLKLSYHEKRLDDTLSDILGAQKALRASALVLANLPDSLPSYTYCMTLPENVTGTINVVTQVPPLTTTTTVASIPVSTAVSHWLVTTGVAFSFAGANSYSNAPLFKNGQPVLDPSGKTLTIVTQSTTKPTVLVPVVMGHYMIPWLNRWAWENSCPRHCGFLLSGGAGLNVTASQKSADFLGGTSFQLGSVLITAAAHVTWDVRLTQGVALGEQFGSSPPNPLPTKRSLVTKFAIGISYVLPFGGASTK
jgi:hypothetical protein